MLRGGSNRITCSGQELLELSASLIELPCLTRIAKLGHVLGFCLIQLLLLELHGHTRITHALPLELPSGNRITNLGQFLGL